MLDWSVDCLLKSAVVPIILGLISYRLCGRERRQAFGRETRVCVHQALALGTVPIHHPSHRME